jgi:uncharacterized protein (TIGR02145 family)
LFTDVRSVTIGGSACSAYDVLSSSLIACKLPNKAAGSTNNISVVNSSGTDLTNASTYNHMKITYFNPSTPTVTTGSTGTTYKFYPNGFTSADCAALTASNSTSDDLPDSIVYVRDTRHKQTYRVKRIIDNKCWMIDNLKYIDTSIVNSADGSTGMTYNNGDHNGDGISGDYNTSGGSIAGNMNKAFYNNPMKYCYGASYMPANTLTRCGYLYSYYAATAGTGGSITTTDGVQATGNICPTGFRLPSSKSGSKPTTNGTGYNYADFTVLNASMDNDGLTTGSSTNIYPARWLYDGQWQGIYSGLYYTGGQYSGGFYWSSTMQSGSAAYSIEFYDTRFDIGYYYVKYYGHAIRCVEDALAPPTITDVNPAAVSTSGYHPRVSPYTTSNADRKLSITGTYFRMYNTSIVTSVTVGGTACTEINVTSDTTLECNLPSLTAGDQVVIVTTTAGSSNVNKTIAYNATPSIDNISGTIWNGNTVTITGANLGGTNNATVTVVNTATICDDLTGSATTLTCTLPPVAAGNRTLYVYTAYGVTNKLVTYVAPTPIMQTITSDTCPSSSKIFAVDARDNHTYYIQTLADGKCWMLTNLAYEGGGANTYGDAKPASNFSVLQWSSYPAASYTAAQIIKGGNGIGVSGSSTITAFTEDPTQPKTGTGQSGAIQTGYLYNYCAAMAKQTVACSNSSNQPSQSINDGTNIYSVCPTGWRLPRGGADAATANDASTTSSELVKLDIALGGSGKGRPDGSSANLRSKWLAVYSGTYVAGSTSPTEQVIGGVWWSSTVTSTSVYGMYVYTTSIQPGLKYARTTGNAVRCVLGP